MNEADAIDIMSQAIWTVLLACGPAVLAAMVIGICVALFQALTQIQEMTLTFIPKILAVFLVLTFTAHFIGAQIYAFSELVYGRIESGF